MDNAEYYAAADENGDICIYSSKPVRRTGTSKRYWSSQGNDYIKIFSKINGVTAVGKFFPITDKIKELTWECEPVKIILQSIG